MSPTQYLDFDVDIAPGGANSYVIVVRSPAGETRAVMQLPYQGVELENRKLKVRNALLSSQGNRRRTLSPEMSSVQQFGADLFGALMQGEVLSRYDLSCNQAEYQEKGLRLKLHLRSPDLMSLPWEFIFDPRENRYLSLNVGTPIVRYIDLPQVIKPLRIEPPLRILGMIANPIDLEPLDVEQEKSRLEEALRVQINSGRVQIHWLEGATWRNLMQVLRTEEFHIFHFVGHGSFDSLSDEGAVAFCDERGLTRLISASELGRLLSDHSKLRLVFLNACEGGRGSSEDIFSSVANTLVQRRIPAVLAMQAEITDRAAIEFSRTFYETISDGYPVDAAASEARKAVSLALKNSLEWGVPVLYMRSPDGRLFDIDKIETTPSVSQPPTPQRNTVEVNDTPTPVQQNPSTSSRALPGRWLRDEVIEVNEPTTAPSLAPIDIQKEFAHRRKKLMRALLLLIPCAVLCMLVAGIDVVGAGGGFVLWWIGVLVCAIYSLRVWRCPKCNAKLGNDLMIKYCENCGAQLQ